MQQVIQGLTSFPPPPGSHYDGAWMRSRKHGYGTMKWQNGDVFEGEFVDNRYTYGCYWWVDGKKYVGEWQDDRPHGQGKMEFGCGFVYKGTWVNGHMSNKHPEACSWNGLSDCNDTQSTKSEVLCAGTDSNGSHQSSLLMSHDDSEVMMMSNDEDCLVHADELDQETVVETVVDESVVGDDNEDEYDQLEIMTCHSISSSNAKDCPDNNALLPEQPLVVNNDICDDAKCTSQQRQHLVKKQKLVHNTFDSNDTETASQSHISHDILQRTSYDNNHSSGKEAISFIEPQVLYDEKRFPNGDVYEGDCKGDLIHGEGICHYANGDCYVGEWQHGKKHGQGKMRFANQSTYEGEWRNDLFNGIGKLQYDQSSSYQGMWLDGKRHGHGEFHVVNSYCYVGDWANDEKHGEGTCSHVSGDRFIGEWCYGKYHGKGRWVYADGTEREGIWMNGVEVHESSEMPLLPSTSVNESHINDLDLLVCSSPQATESELPSSSSLGSQLRTGKKTYSNKDEYEGQFLDESDDVRHGQGRCKYANRDEYVGAWEHDMKHGEGKMIFANGDIYEGQWENDQMCGVGTFIWCSKKQEYVGAWRNNQRHGFGTFKDSYGNIYEGTWENGKRHGSGTFKFNNGFAIPGIWNEGTVVTTGK